MNIELKNVTYKYNEGLAGEVTAIEGIDLNIDGPDFIALIGSTGSGKSTLIQLFNGLLKPTSGDISFDGINIYEAADAGSEGSDNVNKKDDRSEISRMKREKKKRKKEEASQKKLFREIRKRVGIVFQYPESQLFEETVIKDVAFGPKNLGFTEEEALKKAEEALLDVGISKEQFTKSPFELSGGEMRRVAIAGVLAMEPEVLILDEPTAGLDPQGKTEILDRISSIQRRRNERADSDKTMTVVFVSHNMEEVAEYSDRVIAMHGGHKIFDGKPRDLFVNYETFKETGLKAPDITYLCKQIGIEGVITVDEAADAIFIKYGRTDD